MKRNHKKIEIIPVPTIPNIPSVIPEIMPQPDKNKPEHSSPDIIPSTHPEIAPVKKPEGTFNYIY